MKLNVYKSQTEIAKTLEVEAYDLMYGTVEDILSVLDEIGDNPSNEDLFKALAKNRGLINNLLLDVFPEMEREDLRNIKLKELVPFFLELFAYVKDSFSSSKN